MNLLTQEILTTTNP